MWRLEIIVRVENTRLAERAGREQRNSNPSMEDQNKGLCSCRPSRPCIVQLVAVPKTDLCRAIVVDLIRADVSSRTARGQPFWRRQQQQQQQQQERRLERGAMPFGRKYRHADGGKDEYRLGTEKKLLFVTSVFHLVKDSYVAHEQAQQKAQEKLNRFLCFVLILLVSKYIVETKHLVSPPNAPIS